MPTRPKTDPDALRVSVVVNVTVSEKRWRALMAAAGVDLTGVVVAAHVALTVRALSHHQLASIGFPQN